MRDRFAGQRVPERQAGRLVECREQARIVRRIDDDQDAAKILGGRAHERRPADIDLLDEGIECGRRVRRRLCEGIQVDDDEVDEAKPMALERGQIVGPVAPRENASVKGRMQRLHAAVHHLWKAGQVRDARDGEAGLGKRSSRSTGRDQLEPAGREAAAEIGNTGLVRDAQQGSWHSDKSQVSFM